MMAIPPGTSAPPPRPCRIRNSTRIPRVGAMAHASDAVVKAADGKTLLRMQDLLNASEAYLAEFHLLPFDLTAAGEFDRLRNDKKVRKTDRNDLLIACVALAHAATLVTRNTKDYANVPGLKLENWAD